MLNQSVLCRPYKPGVVYGKKATGYVRHVYVLAASYLFVVFPEANTQAGA
jgi:hypothetical protein